LQQYDAAKPAKRPLQPIMPVVVEEVAPTTTVSDLSEESRAKLVATKCLNCNEECGVYAGIPSQCPVCFEAVFAPEIKPEEVIRPPPAKQRRLNKDAAWTQHESEDGTPYYYNSVTEETTWEYPETMQQAFKHDYTRHDDGSVEIDQEQVDRLIGERLQAKFARDYETADQIRDQLRAMGVEMMDKEKAYRVRPPRPVYKKPSFTPTFQPTLVFPTPFQLQQQAMINQTQQQAKLEAQRTAILEQEVAAAILLTQQQVEEAKDLIDLPNHPIITELVLRHGQSLQKLQESQQAQLLQTQTLLGVGSVQDKVLQSQLQTKLHEFIKQQQLELQMTQRHMIVLANGAKQEGLDPNKIQIPSLMKGPTLPPGLPPPGTQTGKNYGKPERPVVTEKDIESYIEQLEKIKAEITEAVAQEDFARAAELKPRKEQLQVAINAGPTPAVTEEGLHSDGEDQIEEDGEEHTHTQQEKEQERANGAQEHDEKKKEGKGAKGDKNDYDPFSDGISCQCIHNVHNPLVVTPLIVTLSPLSALRS